MNHDVLERLLMDRALGGLPLDVNALLNAYLERDPAAAAKAAKMDETVDLATRALKPKTQPALPPLKVQPFVLPEARPSRNRMAWAAGIAAAFVLGAGLGAMFLHSNPPTPSRAVVVDVVRSTESQPSGIWSRSRWTNRLARASSPEEPRLTWISPVKRPVVNN